MFLTLENLTLQLEAVGTVIRVFEGPTFKLFDVAYH